MLRGMLSGAVRGSILSASLICSTVLFQFAVFWLSPAYFFLLITESVGVLKCPIMKVLLSLSSIPSFFFMYLGAVMFGTYTFIIVFFVERMYIAFVFSYLFPM